MAAPLFDPAVGFFAELEQDNTRAWWAAHRHRYDHEVKPPFLDVLTELGGSWRVYRPNNDTRFSSAKGPYKTFLGAVTEDARGVGAFVQISSRGLLVGTGMPMLAPDQLQRYRSAVAAPEGDGLASAIEVVRSHGSAVHGGRWDPLARTPRGFDPQHPRAELLRWKGVETNTRVTRPPWTDVTTAARAVQAAIDAGGPVDTWLGTHVGPSALTPEERFAPRKR